MQEPIDIFSYRKFWAKRFGVSKVLPMSRAEMDDLGWDSCDIIIVTGDAYVDHPSFGMALIGRLLESQGFRVGIISQPDWRSVDPFRALGKPNLFFGVTSGNMDSMVNNYTADRKIRTDDSYSPNAVSNKRPNRAVTVYSHRCREAYKDVPIVLGGIEASLRRVAHYDYWSDKVKPSVIIDSKADILVYGNAERAIVELAHRLARKENIRDIAKLRGTVVVKKIKIGEEKEVLEKNHCGSKCEEYLILPSYEEVASDKLSYAKASRILHLETNPFNAKILVQAHADRYVWVNPPPIPLTTKELDGVYNLPYSRLPHPSYGDAKIPAYEMISCSVNIMRGCFGGCSFCSITTHEGRIIQNRSLESIVEEIESIVAKTPSFTGIISDLGGPTANMYHLKCRDKNAEARCRRFSCLYPDICKNMDTDHSTLINLYRKTRSLPEIRKILVSSGVRYDLAVKSPRYCEELAKHHVGGYLKIAPEHISKGPLALMMKPGIESYQKFKDLFFKFSQAACKEQYLIPYFIASHPGTTDADMLEVALWLKENDFRLEKVQNFIPTPLTLATTMYHTGFNPLKSLDQDKEKVFVPKSEKTRRLHKAFLRYHDKKNWPLLREALRRLGRSDLIGFGKRFLIPPASYMR